MTWGSGFTHRPLSSSFLGLPYRILNINHKKELLRGLWVEWVRVQISGVIVWLRAQGYSKAINFEALRKLSLATESPETFEPDSPTKTQTLR